MRSTIVSLTLVLALVAPPPVEGVRADEREPTRPLEHLSETGLYLPGTTTVAPEHLAFAPQYPLWTDGARKSRWLSLPAGATIDARRLEAWDFPVGTRLWKEFVFAGKKVETRMIWRASAGEWVFASYVWSDDGSDAALAPPEGLRNVAEIGAGKRHSVPGRDDCLACHEGGVVPVLGFNALQLSDDRDPLAPHAEPLAPGMVTLATLVERELLTPARPELVTRPPRIAAQSPRERAVLGYLAGNCGGCHNESGPLAPLGLVLAPEGDEPERVLESALGVPGRFIVPGVAAADSRRVAPGAPEHSALLYRMRSRSPLSQMPPLGTVLPDEQALRLVEAWIAEDLGRAP